MFIPTGQDSMKTGESGRVSEDEYPVKTPENVQQKVCMALSDPMYDVARLVKTGQAISLGISFNY